jgi:hypothetical protein
MVLMHRKDIIEQYGFDPAENSSVVEKGVGPTAAINVVPDSQSLEAPSQETPSAGIGQNVLAGAIKSVSSDPMMIYGLGGAAYYWAKRRLMGDSEGSFTDGLYNEGGLDKVRQHIQQKSNEFRELNPDWTDGAVREAVQQYTASPDFFRFNTEQMTPAIKNSLRTAAYINEKTGVNKLPTQENFVDDTLQTLGGLLTPTGFLKVAGIGEKLLGRAGRIAGHVVEATVIPGTPSYRPAVLGANVAGGMVVDEAMRHIQGDPTVLPSGEALQEFFKEQGRREVEAPSYDYTAATETDPTVAPTQPPWAPIAAGVGVAAGALGLRGAFRGRINPPVPRSPARSAEEAYAIRRYQSGINPPTDPNVAAQTVQNLDTMLSREAPLEQVSRQLGGDELERTVQAEMGQLLSPAGRQLQQVNVMERGILPDGTQVAPGRLFFDYEASLPADVRERAHQTAIASAIIRDMREKRVRAAAEALAAPNDPAAQRTAQLWQVYDPSVRRYMPDVDENELVRRQWVRGQDPQIDQYMDLLAQTNATRNDFLLQTGVISQNRHTELSADPYHVSLFELTPNTPFNFDPSHRRIDSLGLVDQAVHIPEAPGVGLRASLEAAINDGAKNLGTKNIVEALTAADPTGREIRVLRPGQDPGTFGATISYRDGGSDVNVQVARPGVADAIRVLPIDNGGFFNFLNTARRYSQFGMVHGAAAFAQSPTSLFYNMVSGNLTARSGVSIGYLSRWMRQIAPNSGSMRRAADIVEAMDWLTKPVAYASTFGQATILGAMGSLGQKLARQAVTQDGLFGHIARNVPGGLQALDRAGTAIGNYFASTWLYQYRRWAEGGSHSMLSDPGSIFRTKKQLIRDMRQYQNGTPQGLIPYMKSVGQGINAILNNVAALHEMTHFSQQLAVEGSRTGIVSEAVVRRVAEDARRSAGNLAAQPGSKALQKASAAIPFFRIGIQSFRHILHAMTARGPWDTALVVGRMGGLVAAMYASTKMMDELGLTNWYYEDLNDFERTTKLRVMKPQYYLERAATGKVTIPENPDEMFYTLALPPETSLFTSPVMFGLEQFGLINRGSNRGNTSPEKDLLYSAAQTFNMGNIPILGAGIAALTGNKIDISAAGRGKPPISPIQGPRAFYGDMPSGIPTWEAEVAKSLFGFTGQLAVQALDAGIQTYNKTNEATTSLARAWEETKGAWVEKTVPSVPGLWDAHKKVYGFTTMSSEIGRLNKVADDLTAAFTNEFTPAGAMRGENRRMINNDDVREMLYVTQKIFNSGAMKKYQELVTNQRNQVNDIGAGKAGANYAQVRDQQEAAIKEMRPYYNEMMDLIQDYNGLLADNYGELLKREGLKPDVESVAKLVRKYSQ